MSKFIMSSINETEVGVYRSEIVGLVRPSSLEVVQLIRVTNHSPGNI